MMKRGIFNAIQDKNLWNLWNLFNLLIFYYTEILLVPCGALMTFILRTAVRPYRLGEYTTAVSETVIC